MKLTGKKNERIADLTYYMLRQLMIMLFVLAVVFFVINKIWVSLAFGFPVILISFMKKDAFKLFMVPATYIIEWKYWKHGYKDQILSNNQDRVPGEWDCMDLLVEYITKDGRK